MQRLVITQRREPVPHIESRVGFSWGWEEFWDQHPFLIGFVCGEVSTVLLVALLLW